MENREQTSHARTNIDRIRELNDRLRVNGEGGRIVITCGVNSLPPDVFAEALAAIATLRPHVDLFFDKVLVMAEDKPVRQNRLRLLARLDELFSSIADLSKIETTTSTSVDASTAKGRESGLGSSESGRKIDLH